MKHCTGLKIGQISIIKDDKENLIINKFLENESAAVR